MGAYIKNMLHYLEDKRIIKKIFGFDKSYKITKEEMEVRKEFLKQLINDYGSLDLLYVPFSYVLVVSR